MHYVTVLDKMKYLSEKVDTANELDEFVLHNNLVASPTSVYNAIVRGLQTKKIELIRKALEVNSVLPLKAKFKLSNAAFLSLLQKAITKNQLAATELFLKYLPLEITTNRNTYIQNLAYLAAHLDHFSIAGLLCNSFDCCIEQTGFGSHIMIPAARSTQRAAFDVLSQLLEKGVHHSLQEPDGNTPLHAATSSNNKMAIRLLLQHGACVNILNSDNNTPLDIAKSVGCPEVIELLEQSKNDNANEVSLYSASVNGNAEAVERLLDYGLLVDSKWIGGKTALYGASEAGNKELVELLLAKGASPFPLKNTWPDLPIAVAIEKQEYEIASRLLTHTLQALNTIKKGNRQRYFAVMHELICALNHCSQLGKPDLVKLILDCGVDPNSLDGHGEAALHLAAANGHLDVVKILVEKGATPALYSAPEEGCNTPLHYSCFYGHVHVSEYLLQCVGVDINCRNMRYETPLYCVLRGYLNLKRKGFVSEASIIFLILRGAKLTRPGRHISELSVFSRRYARERWSFIPHQIQDLIISLRDEGRPIELSAQCRLVIRAAIKVPVTDHLLHELNLPGRLRQYILFQY